jgi:hypothetical protein
VLSCQCYFFSRVGVFLPTSTASHCHVRDCSLCLHADAGCPCSRHHSNALQLAEFVLLCQWQCCTCIRIVCSPLRFYHSKGIRSIVRQPLSFSMCHTIADRAQSSKRAQAGILH